MKSIAIMAALSLLIYACAPAHSPQVQTAAQRFDACDEAYLTSQYRCHDEACRYEAGVAY